MAEHATDGVLFPECDGKRSTTATGREIFADAVAEVDTGLGRRITDCQKWRGQYLVHVRDLTEVSGRDAETAVAIAKSGLASMRRRLTFERGKSVTPVGEAGLIEPESSRMRETATITGTAEPATELVVPYRGAELHGSELADQLSIWVEAGTVEPSFAAAIERVIEHPEWLSMPGRQLVLIGAASEMGPYMPLLRWGADLLAIDVPKPAIWGRLLAAAESGAGRVSFPVWAGNGALAERAGLDLREELPEALAWVRSAADSDRLVIGTYAYLDGAMHVQVTAAADVLAAAMLEERPDTAIAYLATPTDAFVVGSDVVADAKRKWSERKVRAVAQAPLRLLSGGRFFHPSYHQQLADGRGVADALVTIQGPNYALAKRLQRWRGIAAREAGREVSFNVAPSSWTRSVTNNRILGAAYSGAKHFGIEVFQPETTRMLMAAMLAHDLNNGTPTSAQTAHPEMLFTEGAAHGGLWRAAYEPRSALTLAAVAGLPGTLRR